MIATTILCRWCQRPIGTAYYEIFDHVACTPIEVPAAVPPATPMPPARLTARQLRGWDWMRSQHRQRDGHHYYRR